MSKTKKSSRHLHPTNELQIPINNYYHSQQTTKYLPTPNLLIPTGHIKTDIVSKNIHVKIVTDKLLPNTKHLSIPNERLPTSKTTKPTCTLHTTTNQLVPIKIAPDPRKQLHIFQHQRYCNLQPNIHLI